MDSLSRLRSALLFRFSLKFTFIFITALSVLIAVPLNRANLQRRTVSLVYSSGGVVYFENETPPSNTYHETSRHRKTTLLQNLRHSVSQIEFEFHNYDDKMKNAISNFGALQTIRLIGHDSEFGAAKLSDDFPGLEIVDVPAEWQSKMGQYFR